MKDKVTVVASSGRARSGVRDFLENQWVRFAMRKIWTLLLSFVILVILTFAVVHLIPGDPARAAAGDDATTDVVEQVRHELGLDQPLGVQFVHYVGNIFSGTMGQSYRVGTVGDYIMLRLPFTLTVALASIAIALFTALALGFLVAIATRGGRHRVLGLVFSAVTAFIDAVPVYIRATILVILFAVSWKVLPAGGARTNASYVLPVCALSIGPLCSLARIVRRETENALQADYIRTTRGWRLPYWTVCIKYVLPNVLISTLTLSGVMLSGMIGGALIMEKVFAWPGLGTSVIEAVINRDYPVVQGTVLVLGMMAVVINIVVDLLVALIDRRTLNGSNES